MTEPSLTVDLEAGTVEPRPAYRRVLLKLSGEFFGNGQVGVLVAGSKPAGEVATEVAMHVAAYSPVFLTRDEVPADTVADERRIAEETSRNEGKPEAAISKIVEGRLNGFFKDQVLLEQAYARDPKKTVGKVVTEAGGELTGFVRFRVGA